MILTRKYQCYTCKHWGKINGYAGSCCITFDNNKDRTHMERIPKRSSCWCDGYESNGRKPQRGWIPFLRLGEYLTKRYGYNIVMAGSLTDSALIRKVTVESNKLKLPITIIFTFNGTGGYYSTDDVIRILKGYEVKNNG